jgi:hypothetical protein
VGCLLIAFPNQKPFNDSSIRSRDFTEKNITLHFLRTESNAHPTTTPLSNVSTDGSIDGNPDGVRTLWFNDAVPP